MSEISLVQKKIISSLLYGYYDILSIYFARIYTVGKENKFWLYSGLEGALIYCIDLRAKVLRFLLFNLKTYEIIFDCELYKKFNLDFQKGNDTFYFFGVNGGYIGLEIPNKQEADKLGEEIASLSEDLVKNKLKNIKNMKENEMKLRGLKMIKLLKQKLKNSLKKPIKSELVINQRELENSLNTIEIDEENQRLILTGTGYIGIDKELKKVRGLRIEENNNIEEDQIFSKYIARNILGNLMRNLVVPRRKIDRDVWGEGVEVVQPKEEKAKTKKENKGKNEDQKNSINIEEEPEEIINEIEDSKIEIISLKEKEIPPQPPPQNDISKPEKKYSSKKVDLDDESENKNIIILNQEKEEKDYESLNLKKKEFPHETNIDMKTMIMTKRNEIKSGKEKINKKKSEIKPMMVQNNQSIQKQVKKEETKKEEEKNTKIINKPIEEKSSNKNKKEKNTKQINESNTTSIKIICGKGKTIPPAPPYPFSSLKTSDISKFSSLSKPINFEPKSVTLKKNFTNIEVKEKETNIIKNQEDNRNSINISNNINLKSMIFDKRNNMKKIGGNLTSSLNSAKKLNNSLNPKNSINEPKINSNNNLMYKSLKIESSINSINPKKPPDGQKKPIETKNQTNKINLLISNFNKKPETNIENIKKPLHTGNNFANKLAALQVKFENRNSILSNSSINSNINNNKEPSKPIIELSKGNTKTIDVKKLVSKFEKEKNKKVVSKKVNVKIISGKGKGIPPCPTPPPSPKF